MVEDIIQRADSVSADEAPGRATSDAPVRGRGIVRRREAAPARTDLRLAQLLCSRLCHDLTGPVGAIATGLELLPEENGGADTLGLLTASAGRLTRQIAFFRWAFGMRGGGRPAESVDEAAAIAARFVDGGRIRLDWPTVAASGRPGAGEAPAGRVRLVLCLVLVAMDALGRGGRIRIEWMPDAWPQDARIAAEGRGAALPAAVRATLGADADAGTLSARTVHAHFALHLAAAIGATIDVEETDGAAVRLIVRFREGD